MKKGMQNLRRAIMLSVIMSTNVVWGGTALAAEEPQNFFLDDIVVTATRTPVELFDAHANIGVISAKQIENRHYTDVKEAIRDVAGVTISDYGRAGYENSNTLRINGSDKVIVLVDGVRISQSCVNAAAVLNFVPVENIERIEVLKGAASALYGADAKGGVVNIITKDADAAKTVLGVAGGNFGAEKYSLMHQGKDGKWSYRVNAKKELLTDAEDGNGKTIPRDKDATTLGFMVKTDFSEGNDLAFSYNRYRSTFMYDDQLYNGGIATGEHNTDEWSVVSNQKINDNLSNRFSFKRLTYDDNYSNNTYAPIAYNIKSFIFDDQFSAKLSDKHNLIAGVTYMHDDVDYINQYQGASAPYSVIKEAIISKAVFLQEQWQISRKWDLNTGLRYDSHSIAGNATTPRFNLGLKADEKNNYYISYSKFFVAPGVSNYFHGTYGNPNLDPEKGYTWELGWNHKFDDTFTSSAHVYYRKSHDAIGYYSGKYNNITSERAKGFDIQFRKNFENGFHSDFGYTYFNTRESTAALNSESVNASGALPRHQINIGLGYDVEKFATDFTVRGAIDRKGSPNGYYPTENYWLVDWSANYKATKNIKAYFKINNLFDKFYAERAATASDPERWYTMPGRSFLVGMEYSF